MEKEPLYRRLADHYRTAIEAGALAPGNRFPSVRSLMGLHAVSLSTALQVCRQLEKDEWLEARPRSGYFVRQPHRHQPLAIAEPALAGLPDPAQFVGIHVRVSEFIARGRAQPVPVNLSGARAAAALYPAEALKSASLRLLRGRPELLVTPGTANGEPAFRHVLARRDRRHPGLHRSPAPGAAGGDPARRCRRDRVAVVLRPVAGAGKSRAQGAGNSDQSAHRHCAAGARTGAEDAAGDQGAGGSAASAESARLHHARRAQGRTGRAVRRRRRGADRGRYLQPAGRLRAVATGAEIVG